MQGRARALLLLCCVSGMAGLSSETLYLRVLSTHVFGDVYLVAFAVLGGVYLGLGAGAAASSLLARHVWAIEGVFGIFSLTVAFTLADGGGAGDGGVLQAFCAGFFPFLLIGTVVPSLAALLGENVRRDRGFNLTYGIYNFWAATAVLITEYALTRAIGLQWSLVVFGVVNLLIAAALHPICRSSRLPATVSIGEGTARALILAGAPLAALGCAATVWHLHALDFAWRIYGPFQETFSLVLASAIWGLAIAGMAAVWLRVALHTAALWGMALGLLTIAATGPLIEAWSSMPLSHVTRAAALVMLFLPCFSAIGLAAPAAAQSGLGLSGGGILTFLSFGNFCGLLLYSLALRDQADAGAVAMAVACGFALCAALSRGLPAAGTAAAAAVAAVIAAQLTWAVFPKEIINASSHSDYLGRSNFERVAEDVRAGNVAAVNRSGFGTVSHVLMHAETGGATIIHNGYRVFGLRNNPVHLVRRETSLAQIAAAHSRRVSQAYVIGLGTGITAMGVAENYRQIDVIDINPMMLEIAGRDFARLNKGVMQRANISVQIGDALHDISRRRTGGYDAVVNTASSPLYLSTSKIYTEEFYRHVLRTLAPGGVYVGWMDSRVGERGIEIMMNTLDKVFGECAMYVLKPGYYAFVCARELRERRRLPVEIASARMSDEFWQSRRGTADVSTLNKPRLSGAELMLSGEGSEVINRVMSSLRSTSPQLENAACYFTENCWN